jgi:hypothetical protein
MNQSNGEKYMSFKGLVILIVVGLIAYSIYQVNNNSPFSKEVAARVKMERLQKNGGHF